MRGLRRVVTILAAAVSVGCEEEQAPPLKLGARHDAIVDGIRSPMAQDAVVCIAIRPQGALRPGFCTGTLVAPNLVLTARHCVSKTDPAIFTCESDGTASAGGGIQSDYAPGELTIYRGIAAKATARADGAATTNAAARGAKIVTE